MFHSWEMYYLSSSLLIPGGRNIVIQKIVILEMKNIFRQIMPNIPLRSIFRSRKMSYGPNVTHSIKCSIKHASCWTIIINGTRNAFRNSKSGPKNPYLFQFISSVKNIHILAKCRIWSTAGNSSFSLINRHQSAKKEIETHEEEKPTYIKHKLEEEIMRVVQY